MKVTEYPKDTIMRPVNEKDLTFCDQLMQGSIVAAVKLFSDAKGIFLEFTPISQEDIEE